MVNRLYEGDALTPEERAAYRMFRAGVHTVDYRAVPRRSVLGLYLNHIGWGFVEIGVSLIWWRFALRFNTFEAYRRVTLSQGPYRNA